MDLFNTVPPAPYPTNSTGTNARAPRKCIKRTFCVHEDDGSARTVTLVGRDAWAMGELIHAGAVGNTSLENPAPRLSGYIHKLRHRYGINIASLEEEHDGPYSGRHARYLLQQRVQFVSYESEAE